MTTTTLPAIQWLAKIADPDLRRMALKNANDPRCQGVMIPGDEFFDKKFDNFYYALSVSFFFEDTPQGNDFWNNHLEKGIPLLPE